MLVKSGGATVAATKYSIQYLSSLQSWQLKHLCTNLGISAGPKKSTTAAALVAALGQYARHTEQPRIKSVDMGVKNLAYCMLRPRERATDGAQFRVYDWRRINVLTGESTTAQAEVDDEKITTDGDGAEEAPALTNLYSPANLAPVAARLAGRLASDMDPSHIVIERQRFRSMGGSSVQEWTLRVNSLEAMLWASLQTLRDITTQSTPATAFPQTVEMNPARIAAYWNTRASDWSLNEANGNEIIPEASDKQPQRKGVDDSDVATKRGMEKSEKISLIRHWLETGAIDVDDALQPLADAFMIVGRARKTDGDLVIGKKDDLADCVVQGVTFSLWSRNRQLLAQRLDQEATSLT
ncbi:hypothetical protein ANO11243_009130 [Dothideomycetidae sp. 11243]|nr:hypothetical protein ANO11243_009130 [fungal sp. No.11243]